MTENSSGRKTSIALAVCKSYSQPILENALYQTLDAARIPVFSGMKALVKPNLLMSRPLACASPEVTAGVCKWLMDKGARVSVADSPGFGRAASVSKAIGLDAALAPLGLKVKALAHAANTAIQTYPKKVSIPIARLALESDMIFSVARIKAHSQMRMTLCVKNCFGCVPGLRKAFFHARNGASHEFFARCIMRLWQALPPVAGIADGIMAMHVTGPSRGEPFPLGLLGACANAAALDSAILSALKINKDLVPLAKAISEFTEENEQDYFFPLASPDDFNAEGFEIPASLKPPTFNPLRLAKSCLKRIWYLWKGGKGNS